MKGSSTKIFYGNCITISGTRQLTLMDIMDSVRNFKSIILSLKRVLQLIPFEEWLHISDLIRRWNSDIDHLYKAR